MVVQQLTELGFLQCSRFLERMVAILMKDTNAVIMSDKVPYHLDDCANKQNYWLRTIYTKDLFTTQRLQRDAMSLRVESLALTVLKRVKTPLQ